VFQQVEKMESLKIVISWQLCNFTLHFLADSNSDTATEKARLRFAHAETVIPFICLLGLFLDDVGKSSCAWYGGHSAAVLELTNQITEANELM
jgi:hypothetical protein